MKEDFQTIKEQLPGILRVSSDFYQRPRKRGACYFVKSPKTADKHESLALYPDSGRFVDYANGNQSGDCIAFLAYVRGCNQWQSLNTLKDYYGLDSREQDKQETRRKIQMQKEHEHKKRARRQAFHMALFDEIDRLKRWEIIYKTVLKNGLYKPFSDVWCYVMNELQKVEYRLDILCCADQHTYRFMKNGSEYIASDYPQWILDTLDVLAEEGMFRASESELMQIRKRVNFEIVKPYGCKEKV